MCLQGIEENLPPTTPCSPCKSLVPFQSLTIWEGKPTIPPNATLVNMFIQAHSEQPSNPNKRKINLFLKNATIVLTIQTPGGSYPVVLIL